MRDNAGLAQVASAIDRLTFALLGGSALDGLTKGSPAPTTSPVTPPRWRQWLEAVRRPLVDPELTVSMVTDEEGWVREQTPEEDEDE